MINSTKKLYICGFHIQSEDSIKQLEEKLKISLKKSYEKTVRATSTVSRLKKKLKTSKNMKLI